MNWGHYGDMASVAIFALFMVAWNLLALDLWCQLKRWDRRKEEREQWESSSVS